VATESKLIWRKGVAVGPFIFGTPVSNYSGLLRLVPEPWPTTCGASYETLSRGDDVMVYEEGGLIDSISCYSEFWIEDVNIMGIPKQALIDDVLSEPDDAETQEIGEDIQEILYYYSIGLMVWLSRGIIVTVQARKEFSDD
jgi:hypothetical protein